MLKHLSQPTTTTGEVLKIKKVFLNLQAKKIKNIQKIINDYGKPKPKINMTIKSPSRKQVIISMSNNNKTKFIKDSCNYITNINRAFKNIKSEVIVDFIHSDQSGVTIFTNKVVSFLNLQTIENYVKSAKYIIAEGVKIL